MEIPNLFLLPTPEVKVAFKEIKKTMEPLTSKPHKLIFCCWLALKENHGFQFRKAGP